MQRVEVGCQKRGAEMMCGSERSLLQFPSAPMDRNEDCLQVIFADKKRTVGESRAAERTLCLIKRVTSCNGQDEGRKHVSARLHRRGCVIPADAPLTRPANIAGALPTESPPLTLVCHPHPPWLPPSSHGSVHQLLVNISSVSSPPSSSSLLDLTVRRAGTHFWGPVSSCARDSARVNKLM